VASHLLRLFPLTLPLAAGSVRSVFMYAKQSATTVYTHFLFNAQKSYTEQVPVSLIIRCNDVRYKRSSFL